MENVTLINEILNVTGDANEKKGFYLFDIDPSATFCVIILVVSALIFILAPICLFCKCNSSQELGKDAQSLPETELQNGDYQAYAVDDVTDFVDNRRAKDGNFVNVELREEAEAEAKSDFAGEEIVAPNENTNPNAKSTPKSCHLVGAIGERCNHQSDSVLILDAAELTGRSHSLKDIELKFLPFSKSVPESNTSVLHNLKSFVRNTICKSNSVAFANKYGKSLTNNFSRELIRNLSNTEAISASRVQPCFNNNLNGNAQTTAKLQRSLSLPTRLRKSCHSKTPKDRNNVVSLWVEMSTTEDVKGEASALYSAVLNTLPTENLLIGFFSPTPSD